MKRWLAAAVVVGCGSNDAPNTVTGTLTIGGKPATVTACELAAIPDPARAVVAVTFVTALGRVRVTSHGRDNGYDFDLDGKAATCTGQTVSEGEFGHQTAPREKLYWNGHFTFHCRVGDIPIEADLTLDCAH